MTITAPRPSTDASARTTTAVPVDSNRGRRWWLWSALALGLIGAHWIAFEATGFRPDKLVSGATGIASFLGEAFPPDLSSAVLADGLAATAQTLWVGLLGTTLSAPLAFLLAALGARTVSPNQFVYQVARAIMSFFRAVPDIVFALIFVTAVGLGPFAGVLALICHNTGVMGKLWSEAMEEVDPGPEQALRTAGASRPQILVNATLPLVLPQLVGLLLYRFDVNVRSSLVLGLVGAGGIGLLINRAIKSFQFDEMMTYLIIVLILIIAVDLASAAIRKRMAA